MSRFGIPSEGWGMLRQELVADVIQAGGPDYEVLLIQRSFESLSDEEQENVFAWVEADVDDCLTYISRFVSVSDLPPTIRATPQTIREFTATLAAVRSVGEPVPIARAAAVQTQLHRLVSERARRLVSPAEQA